MRPLRHFSPTTTPPILTSTPEGNFAGSLRRRSRGSPGLKSASLALRLVQKSQTVEASVRATALPVSRCRIFPLFHLNPEPSGFAQGKLREAEESLPSWFLKYGVAVLTSS